MSGLLAFWLTYVVGGYVFLALALGVSRALNWHWTRQRQARESPDSREV
jgi:hypothetical protein